MTTSNQKEDLKKDMGGRLKKCREEIMKIRKISFEEFAGEVDITVNKFKAYEAGRLYPGYKDLEKMGCSYGINLNWVIYRNGSMLFAREKDMEELTKKIEADESGRYEHYKMLLKSMQSPFMEDIIFSFHGALVDLLLKLKNKLKESQDNINLLSVMTDDVDYELPKFIEALIKNEK
jgi:transcriptional regulator with XRE-family HTH domain